MKNRDIFQRDPASAKLANDGVASVAEGNSPKEIDTLRYELEHFVCEGQYKEGMARILESYLGNASSAAQPAAWISGFYGSGKSHLLKMFRHLWVDTRFADGATAQGLAQLPPDIKDLLKELATFGKRCEGAHAASGTLPSGSNTGVRLTVLGIIFRSKGLPETYPQARFCMWLQKNGLFDKVRTSVEAFGKDFFLELRDLYVSPVIAKALLAADPAFAKDEKEARATLRAQFPNVQDISTNEFVQIARQAITDGGPLPASVILLDEVQQHIGENTDRAIQVQEVAEALCKQTDSRVLLIGAGQSALTATPYLQKLMGRFTIPIELSDLDVETVTRRVVLAKKATMVKPIQECLAANAGEIDRQLAGSSISAKTDDRQVIVDDYPLLPVRRRFWEHALRAVDTAGTTAQLRTQLKLVHDAVHDTAEAPLGTVVPADFVFEQLQAGLVQTGLLLRELDDMIRRLDDGTPAGRLARRLCGLIFLIRKLPRDAGHDIGVRATPEMLADLLVSDLANDGAALRRDIQAVLDKLVADGKLIKLEDGYALQTKESSEWEREFRSRQSKLVNDVQAISAKRSALLAAAVTDTIGNMKLLHGKSKEPRKLVLHFGDQAPATKGHEIPVWSRDGWGESEPTVVNDARAAGSNSPIVFVFIPKVSAEELKRAIADYEAARATIDFKGTPSTNPGQEARAAMDSRMREAEARRDEIISQVLDAAKVFQGGGTEGYQLVLAEKIKAAAEASLDRLFPDFHDADSDKWDRVISRAKNGDEAALQAIGWNDKPDKHPVCAAILSAVGSGKKGKDVRAAFEDTPYGWSRDAVDAGLIVLHTAGQLRALHNGVALATGQLDQAKIPVTEFRVEHPSLDITQKMALRKLYQAAGISCKPGAESAQATTFLAHLLDLADKAGGSEPLPARPTIAHIDTLRGYAGNEQLDEILKQQATLAQQATDWAILGNLAAKRLPAWETLTQLLTHVVDLPEGIELKKQADAVRHERRLLASSDPVPAIHKAATTSLRTAVNKCFAEHSEVFTREKASLEGSDNWKKLSETQQHQILVTEGILGLPKVNVSDDAALLDCLSQCPLASWKTRTNALPQQFANAALAAAKLLEPKAQSVHLTSSTLKTPEDVKAWLTKTEQELLPRLTAGPIFIS